MEVAEGLRNLEDPKEDSFVLLGGGNLAEGFAFQIFHLDAISPALLEIGAIVFGDVGVLTGAQDGDLVEYASYAEIFGEIDLPLEYFTFLMALGKGGSACR
ncbi:unnamed protein product [Sphagnum balticum]